jgi:small-conductance mechanosensitive channel
MNKFLTTLDNLYLENRLSAWLWALVIFFSVLLVTLMIRRLIRRQSKRLAETPKVELIEVPLLIASRTTSTFLLVISAFTAMVALRLPELTHHIADKVLLIVACWQVGIWATAAALAWIDMKRNASLVDDRATAGSLGIISIIVRGVIWAIVLLLTLDNLGINITTLVAGLGIGGIAIALAVQNVLGDLLASLSITLDKPFVLGDSLQVDNFSGKVENIGIKTTRLRSVDGEQIIMPNSDLLKSRMRNFGRMQERRVVFTIGVTYETPRAKLGKIPGMVRAIVEAQDKVRVDRCHLARLNAYSIDCDVVYFMLTADYNVYMDTQQKIILALIDAFESEQIEFAYPTQRTVTTDTPTTTTVTA